MSLVREEQKIKEKNGETKKVKMRDWGKAKDWEGEEERTEEEDMPLQIPSFIEI